MVSASKCARVSTIAMFVVAGRDEYQFSVLKDDRSEAVRRCESYRLGKPSVYRCPTRMCLFLDTESTLFGASFHALLRWVLS